MGKEQGDFLETPVIYTKTIDGEVLERSAYTPADHVNFQARGWVKQENAQTAQPRATTVPAAPVKPVAENNAGSAPV